MIPLKRVRTDVAIDDNFRGVKRVLKEKELLENQRKIKRGEIEEHSFETNFWKKAKDQLKEETHDKCAYCEAPTSMVAYGDVEHFRPKSKYWWLAYNYDNYLVSCQLCNQKFKKAKFPIPGRMMKGPKITAKTSDHFIEFRAGSFGPDPLVISGNNPGSMSVNTFVQLHRNERPFLLNPYFDNPGAFFAWKVDDLLREVEVVPLNDNMNKFWEAARDDYGLNRLELKKLRYFIYMLYNTLRLTLMDPGISNDTRQANQEAIENMMADEAPFAGMIRYFESQRGPV